MGRAGARRARDCRASPHGAGFQFHQRNGRRLMPDRRSFLRQAGAASAAGLLYRPGIKRWTGAAAEAFPEPDEARLRAFALAAVDAARAAGADFADVRVAVTRTAST